MPVGQIEHCPERYQTIRVFGDTYVQTDLRMEAARFSNMLGLLRRHGMTFPNTPFDDRFPVDPKERCYDMAAKVSRDYELVYVEGVMVFARGDGGALTLGHAWCCDKSGKQIIDPTAHRHQNSSFVAYIGVPIKQGYLWRWHADHGYHGIMDGFRDGRRSPIHTQNPDQFLHRFE